MKKFYFLYCKEGLLYGFLGAISAVSSEHLREAINLLESNREALLYVSIDEIVPHAKKSALELVQNVIKNAGDTISSRVHVSYSQRRFEDPLMEYLSHLNPASDIRLEIVGEFSDVEILKIRIDEALLNYPGCPETGRLHGRMPAVLMA